VDALQAREPEAAADAIAAHFADVQSRIDRLG
jgi:DNA-binding FadR family transcriptional regulator